MRALVRLQQGTPALACNLGTGIGYTVKELLGWTPQRSGLEQILRDAWGFLRAHPRGF